MDLVPKQEQHKEEEEKEEEKESMILAEHSNRANFGHGGSGRSEIKEVDFFSTGGARRRTDDDDDGDGEDWNREASGAPGRGNTTVNVSLRSR
jgi:hypothetical protein